MPKLLSFFCMLITICCYSQKNSDIHLDSSSANDITVIQSGNDSMKSNIGIKHGDSNKLNVSQSGQDSTKKEATKQTGFMKFISNTNNVFILLISIATFLGLLFKGISVLQNKKKKR